MNDIGMGYLDALEQSDFLLTDGATGTCLEQETPVRLDPVIGPTGLVDDDRGRAALEGHEFGLKVLGGCCGTDDRHIAALARRLTGDADRPSG